MERDGGYGGVNGDGILPDPVQVDAVMSIPRIPPFWKKDPRAWFIQVEASFRVSNTRTDLSKIYILTGVDHEVMEHVSTNSVRYVTGGSFEANPQREIKSGPKAFSSTYRDEVT